MQLNEFIEEPKQLDEGIKFFKNSKRLFKLAKRIEKKNRKEQLVDIKKLVSDIESVAFEFEDIESAFSNARSKEEKQKIKSNYKELVNKYKTLIKQINKESVIKGLKVIGGIGLVAVSVLALENAFTGFANAFGGAEARNFELGQQLSAAQDVRPSLGPVEGALLDRQISQLAQERAGLSTQIKAGRAKLAGETGAVAGFAGLTTLASKIFSNKSKSSTTEISKRTFQRLRREAKRPA